jgi:hypothetical protein
VIPLWRQRLGTVVSYVGFVLIDSAERLEETGDTMLRWSIEIDPEATTVARLQKFDPDWVVHPGATLLDWREENRLTVEEAALRWGV